MTLREIMDLTPLGKATLVAGRDALNNVVLDTNIIEVPDTVRWMKGGEIVFSAGYAFGGDADLGVQLIRELSANNIAALTLKPGKYMPIIPQKLIEEANKLRFPILQLPSDMPYSVCIEAIYDKLKKSKVKELRFITETQMALLQASIYGSINEICETLEKYLNRKIYIWTNEKNILYGKNVNSSIFSEENMKNSDIQIYTVKIKRDVNEVYAYLGVTKNINSLSKSEDTIMQYTISLLSIELMREEELKMQYIRLSGSLLDNLLENVVIDTNILRRYAKTYHINLNAKYIIFAIKQGIKIQKLWNNLSNTLNGKDIGLLLTEKSSCIIGALFFNNENYIEKIDELLLKTLSEDKMSNLLIGKSNICDEIGQLNKNAQDAEEALQVISNIPYKKKIASLEELCSYFVLFNVRNKSGMDRICERILGPIIEYDKENDSKLIDTLEQYYYNDYNLRKTSDKMFMHKNSVSYRLKKIEEITGRRLEDSNYRMDLQLCIQYYRMKLFVS